MYTTMRFFLRPLLLVIGLCSAALTTNNVEVPIADNLAVTTTFTQPAECNSGILTEMALYPSDIWQNVIDPVPSSTITSCYPSQFYSSVLATTSLPAFSALICPYNWETYPITGNYIICCPDNYGVYAPNLNNTDRPGESAICYSTIVPYELVDISSYDSTAFVTFTGVTAGANGTLVYAYAFDGTAAVPGSTIAIATSTEASNPSLTSTLYPTTSISSSIASPTAGKTTSGLASPTSSDAIYGTLATSIAKAPIGYWALAFLAWFWLLA